MGFLNRCLRVVANPVTKGRITAIALSLPAPVRSCKSMQGPQFLSADQFLLTTLVVKLAVMAALSTMLVRYRRFRHILIFERRAWPDCLIFALSFGLPLSAGVGARLLLGANAADRTLAGRLGAR